MSPPDTILHDWGYVDDDYDAWWKEEGNDHVSAQADQPTRPRPGNGLRDRVTANTVVHELDRDFVLAHAGTEPAGDITAVVATVVSRVATSARIMAKKAYEKLVVYFSPFVGRHDQLDDRPWIGLRLFWVVT